MNVLAQVRVWNLDPAEGVAASSCVDDGSVVLGVLGGSVVSVARSSRLRIFDPVHGDQTETVFEAPAGHLDTAVCVLLQKRQKVLLVSEDGSLHQVRNPPCSARLRNTRDPRFRCAPAGGSGPRSPLVRRFPGRAIGRRCSASPSRPRCYRQRKTKTP